MKRSLYSFACVFGLASVGWADVKTFSPTGGTGDWDDPDNWSPSGIPTASDRAVIPANKTCNIPTGYNAVADTIEVEADGILNINGTGSLTLDNDDDNVTGTPDNSIVDGTLNINDSDSALKFIDNDHGVSGDGAIVGDDTAATIDIEADIVMTNRLGHTNGGVKGSLTITGGTGGTTNGTFNNEGLVHANGTITLDTTTVIDDHDTVDHAEWRITGESGTLRFKHEATGLNGRFYLACNTLDIDENVKTCGELLFNQGTIDIASGKTFKFVTFRTDLGCDNPGTPENRPVSCNDPYVVSSTTSCGGTCVK